MFGPQPSDNSADKGFNLISPAAVFSNCCIFTSASASLSWQILASFMPSSYFVNKLSSGRSPDFIASSLDSIVCKPSSNVTLHLAGSAGPALLSSFGTREKLRQPPASVQSRVETLLPENFMKRTSRFDALNRHAPLSLAQVCV